MVVVVVVNSGPEQGSGKPSKHVPSKTFPSRAKHSERVISTQINSSGGPKQQPCSWGGANVVVVVVVVNVGHGSSAQGTPV